MTSHSPNLRGTRSGGEVAGERDDLTVSVADPVPLTYRNPVAPSRRAQVAAVHRRDGMLRSGTGFRVAATAVGAVLPAGAVYVALKIRSPDQHGLNDIGTGLIRLALTLSTGVIGGLITWLIVRRAR